MNERTLAMSLLFSALSMPLLQAFILLIGTAYSIDLHRQFSEFHEHGPPYVAMIYSLPQGIFGLILGGLAAATCKLRSSTRCFLHLIQGIAGALFFGWFLAQNWNFAFNHKYGGIARMTSPIPFDFLQCVFFGLPLLWCLGLVGFVFFVRASHKPLPSN